MSLLATGRASRQTRCRGWWQRRPVSLSAPLRVRWPQPWHRTLVRLHRRATPAMAARLPHRPQSSRRVGGAEKMRHARGPGLLLAMQPGHPPPARTHTHTCTHAHARTHARTHNHSLQVTFVCEQRCSGPGGGQARDCADLEPSIREAPQNKQPAPTEQQQLVVLRIHTPSGAAQARVSQHTHLHNSPLTVCPEYSYGARCRARSPGVPFPSLLCSSPFSRRLPSPAAPPAGVVGPAPVCGGVLAGSSGIGSRLAGSGVDAPPTLSGGSVSAGIAPCGAAPPAIAHAAPLRLALIVVLWFLSFPKVIAAAAAKISPPTGAHGHTGSRHVLPGTAAPPPQARDRGTSADARASARTRACAC